MLRGGRRKGGGARKNRAKYRGEKGREGRPLPEGGRGGGPTYASKSWGQLEWRNSKERQAPLSSPPIQGCKLSIRMRDRVSTLDERLSFFLLLLPTCFLHPCGQGLLELVDPAGLRRRRLSRRGLLARVVPGGQENERNVF